MASTRRRFLRRSAGALALLGLGRVPQAAGPLEVPPQVVPDVPKVDFTATSIRARLVSSGGLCAPVSPIYDMPAFPLGSHPIAEALPAFSTRRDAPLASGDTSA